MWGSPSAGARGFDVSWARSLVRQCREGGAAPFVKQLGRKPYQSPEHDGGTGYFIALRDAKGGDMAEWPEDIRVREMPSTPTNSGNSSVPKDSV